MPIASATGKAARSRASPHGCSPSPSARGASASPGIDSGRRGRPSGRDPRSGRPRRSRRSSRTGPARPAPAPAARPPPRPRRGPPARSRRAPAGGPRRSSAVVERGGAEVQLGAAAGRKRSGTRLWSSEIGSPSSIRSRRSSSSSAPGAIAERVGLVDRGRPDLRGAARARWRPGRATRPSSDRLISVFGGSTSAAPATNVPRPRPSTRPSATSSSIARRTVARLTPSSSQNQRSDGSRSPGLERAALDLLGDLPVDPVVERPCGVADRHRTPRLFQRRWLHVKHLVRFGRPWYVPVHGLPDTGLWADVRELPGALADTLAAAEGVAAAAELLGGARASSGSWRRATAPPTTSRTRCGWPRSRARPGGPPIVAVPCGVAARDRIPLAAGRRAARRLLVGRVPRRRGDRPARGRSPLRGHHGQRRTPRWRTAATRRRAAARRVPAGGHAHAGAGGRLRVRARGLGGGDGRRRAGGVLAAAPDAAASAVAAAEAWAGEALAGVGHPAGGRRGRRRPAWAAALELALMLKEISRVPAEGVETREGATSAMFGLARGHLMVVARPGGRPARRRGPAPVRGRRRDHAAAARARPAPTRAWRRSRPCRPPPRSRPGSRSPPATTSTGRPGPRPTTRPRERD